MFSRLKLLFNFYVKRTVSRQDFGAKFNLTYHNGAPVADILERRLTKTLRKRFWINSMKNNITGNFPFSGNSRNTIIFVIG